MKETGNNMDCVACGKAISITAKFCGKCGAPVKRSDAVVTDAAVNDDSLNVALVDAAPPAVEDRVAPSPTPEIVEQAPSNHEVDDLVLTMELPAEADHASMLKIDLNLPDTSPPNAAPSEIQQMLEKQSHLLDFIALASQQLTHVQSQPSPLEPVLKEVMALQHALSTKLDQVKASIDKPQAEVAVRMPDEFRLLLEKQKIELLKAFNQNVAQNTANIEAVYKDTATKIESLLQANAATAQAMEKQISPISQAVTDLKSRLQAVSKKIDDVSSPAKKTTSAASADSTEGSSGFILFIIGLLCGLTVVLSSLAIYNFLSHEVNSNAKTSGHESTASDHGNSSAGHTDSAHTGAPAGQDPAAQDKSATDSSKSKSH